MRQWNREQELLEGIQVGKRLEQRGIQDRVIARIWSEGDAKLRIVLQN